MSRFSDLKNDLEETKSAVELLATAHNKAIERIEHIERWINDKTHGSFARQYNEELLDAILKSCNVNSPKIGNNNTESTHLDRNNNEIKIGDVVVVVSKEARCLITSSIHKFYKNVVELGDGFQYTTDEVALFRKNEER